MRILITNNTLAGRAGTEMYVRDISLLLKRQGHEPVCFSMELGDVADEITSQGVKVVSSLAEAHGPFDLIHGHHKIETTLAAMAYPSVPVISFCHGPKLWHELPCLMPNVVQYVAVDEACRERLINEGIPADKIKLLLNFADTQRFRPRGPLPEKPQRAVIFSNYPHGAKYLGVIQEVCKNFNISLDIIGKSAGNVSNSPETVLHSYDLVFAKARAAIEAMAVGCAVVQCEYFGAGWLVRSDNFDQLRPLNFGFKSMTQPITVEHLSSQVAAYDAADAAMISRRIREEASLEGFWPQLLDMYTTTLAAPVPQFDPWQAASVFLQEQIKHSKEAQGQIEDLRKGYAAMAESVAVFNQEREELKKKIKELKTQKQEYKTRYNDLKTATKRTVKKRWWRWLA